MAVCCLRTPTGQCLGIAAFLLLILVQLLVSSVMSGGGFIAASDGVVSPLRSSFTQLYDECFSNLKTCIFLTVTALGCQAPTVLVAFSVLSLLFAAYSRDEAMLWLSTYCQGASSLLLHISTAVFLVYHRSYVSWADMTVWFYNCVAVQLELFLSMWLLCWMMKKQTSDWK